MNKSKGFSLVELMVVIAVIGILAAAGNAIYTGFVQGARQNKVKIALLNLANEMERHYSNNDASYLGAAIDGADTGRPKFTSFVTPGCMDDNQIPPTPVICDNVEPFGYQMVIIAATDKTYELAAQVDAGVSSMVGTGGYILNNFGQKWRESVDQPSAPSGDPNGWK